MNTMKKTLFGVYDSDAAMEKEGRWLDFPEAGIRVLVARAGGSNNAYRAAETKFMGDHIGNIADMSPDEFGYLLAEVYGHAVVLKIEGEGFVDPETGAPMESTPEVHTELLRKLPDFFEDIRMYARARTTYLRQRDKDIAGN